MNTVHHAVEEGVVDVLCSHARNLRVGVTVASRFTTDPRPQTFKRRFCG
jgi:hypothetical protein